MRKQKKQPLRNARLKLQQERRDAKRERQKLIEDRKEDQVRREHLVHAETQTAHKLQAAQQEHQRASALRDSASQELRRCNKYHPLLLEESRSVQYIDVPDAFTVRIEAPRVDWNDYKDPAIVRLRCGDTREGPTQFCYALSPAVFTDGFIDVIADELGDQIARQLINKIKEWHRTKTGRGGTSTGRYNARP